MRIIAEETPSSGRQQVSGSAHNELRGRQLPLPNIAEPLHLNAVSITTKTVIHSEMSRVSKAQQSPTLLTTKKSGIKNKTVDVETTSVEHGKGDAEIPEETPDYAPPPQDTSESSEVYCNICSKIIHCTRKKSSFSTCSDNNAFNVIKPRKYGQFLQ
jgi:hypothetical protein